MHFTDFAVFDMEANGLLEYEGEGVPIADRVYCVCYRYYSGGEVFEGSITDPARMKDFFESGITLVGHNITRYDLPLAKKLLGVTKHGRLIDSLPLSWYLYPSRHEHGLEVWGRDLGIEKPPIADWQNLSIEEYVYRCSEDVKINDRLYKKQLEYLVRLYDNDESQADRFIGYIMYKMDCAREQEEVKWKLDIDKCKENLGILNVEEQKKVEILSSIMPVHIKYKKKSRPKNPFKKDGSESEHGKKWFALLESKGLPKYHNGAVLVEDKREPGNPGSHQQLKEWLFSLGWKPQTYKTVKDKDDPYNIPPRKVPQLTKDDNSGELCDSIIELFEKEPQLEHIEGLFTVRHRIGLLEGFLRDVNPDGFLRAQIAGLTNTLRFKHSTIVNLPTIPKKYWEMVRGVLTAPDEDSLLFGSDMSSLEDNTKQHYMYFYDPEYVTEMRTPGFDPHIDMAKQAKHLSYDEGEFYKWHDHRKEGKVYSYIIPKDLSIKKKNGIIGKTFEELVELPKEEQAAIIKLLKPIRLKDKKTNFAAVYGAGGPKIADTAKITVAEGYTLHKVYWQRNKAVKQVAANTIHKSLDGQMWLWNPVSCFWYSLRYEKDKFSTLNQGTGVYCFDSWTRKVRTSGLRLCGQFHDEIIGPLKPQDREQVQTKLRNAIAELNEEIKLNVPLGISVDFGHNYAEIH